MKLHLPTCPNCHHQYTWKEAWRLAHDEGPSNRPVHNRMCLKCCADLYPTSKTRTRLFKVAISIQFVLLLIMLLCHASNAVLFSLPILYGMTAYAIRPFIYRYQQYEESLFEL